MNKIRPSLKRRFLIVALASAALIWGVVTPGLVSAAGKPANSPAAAQKDLGTGELIIVRSANLGQTVVGVSIDGEQKARINFNGRYETPLSVGHHTITTVPIPNREHAQPSQKQVNVEKGKTYTFTAARSDVAIVLK